MEQEIEYDVSAKFKPALVLNADYRPLSHFPLSLVGWQTAVRAVILEKVIVLEEYDDAVVRSASLNVNVPSVIALKEYAKTRDKVIFSRFNLFLRDSFQCQYCGKDGTTGTLTFDHVVPRASGGKTTWDNVVTACCECNARKGSKPVGKSGMALSRKPKKPTKWELDSIGRKFPPTHMHDSWMDYLYWNMKLDP